MQLPHLTILMEWNLYLCYYMECIVNVMSNNYNNIMQLTINYVIIATPPDHLNFKISKNE